MNRKFLEKVVNHCSQPHVNFYCTKRGMVYTYHHPIVFQHERQDLFCWPENNAPKPRRAWNIETGKELHIKDVK